MKRFALVTATVAALAFFSTSSSAIAFDNHHGFGGHHGYVSHGFVGGYGYAGHGYAAPAFGGGYVRHGYARPAYGGHRYNRSIRHGGGLRISTPHFGLRLGH